MARYGSVPRRSGDRGLRVWRRFWHLLLSLPLWGPVPDHQSEFNMSWYSIAHAMYSYCSGRSREWWGCGRVSKLFTAGQSDLWSCELLTGNCVQILICYCVGTGGLCTTVIKTINCCVWKEYFELTHCIWLDHVHNYCGLQFYILANQLCCDSIFYRPDWSKHGSKSDSKCKLHEMGVVKLYG